MFKKIIDLSINKLIINNYKILTLIVYISINFKINRIIKSYYIIIISTYLIITILFKIVIIYIINVKTFVIHV